MFTDQQTLGRRWVYCSMQPASVIYGYSLKSFQIESYQFYASKLPYTVNLKLNIGLNISKLQNIAVFQGFIIFE